MGEVFRGHDTRLRRTVAVKVHPRQRVTDPVQTLAGVPAWATYSFDAPRPLGGKSCKYRM